MAIVRGRQAVTGIEILPEEVYGSAQAGTGAATVQRIPFLGSSDSTVAQTVPVLNEIGTGGGNPGSELGQRSASGEFTTRIDVLEDYFGLLLALTFGSEYYVADRSAISTTVSGAHAHCFMPQAMTHGAPTPTFQLLMHKSGESTGSLLETYPGAIITGVTFNQPADGPPTATWRWVAIPPTLSTSSGLSSLSTRDLIVSRGLSYNTLADENAGVYIKQAYAASTMTRFPIRSISVEFNRNIAVADGFINKTGLGFVGGEIEKAGFVEPYDINVNIEYPIEDDEDNLYDASGNISRPLDYYVTGKTGYPLRIIWEASAAWTGNHRGSFDITIPDPVWISGEANLVSEELIASCAARGRTAGVRDDAAGTLADQAWDDDATSTLDFKVPIHCQWVRNNAGRATNDSENRMLRFAEGGRGPSYATYSAGASTTFLEQVAYWFIADSGNETQSIANQLAKPDTPIGINADTPFRIRFLLKSHGTQTLQSFRLQFSLNRGAWTGVDSTVQAIQGVVGGGGVTEDDNTTQQMSKHVYGPTSNGGVDAGGAGAGIACDSGVTLAAGEEMEVLYVVQAPSVPTAPGDLIHLRVVRESGPSPCDSYAQIARMVVLT